MFTQTPSPFHAGCRIVLVVFLAEASTNCLIPTSLEGPVFVNGVGAVVGGFLAAVSRALPRGSLRDLTSRFESTYLAVFTSFP